MADAWRTAAIAAATLALHERGSGRCACESAEQHEYWLAEDEAAAKAALEAAAPHLRSEAERGFLAASVAVWREIDRLDAEPGGYHPTRMSVELRQAERAAWERYRDTLTEEERDA